MGGGGGGIVDGGGGGGDSSRWAGMRKFSVGGWDFSLSLIRLQ